MTDEQLTAIYNKANSLDPKRHNPITTERIFVAMRAAMEHERKVWMAAITDEPELPGEMPEEMWEVLRNDRDAATKAMRIAVRQTKGGILKRGMRSNVDVTGPRLRGSGGQQGSASQEPYSGD